MNPVWSRSGIAIAFLLACAGDEDAVEDLRPAPEPYRSITHPIILDLPDTGGFAINLQPVERSELQAQLRIIYEPRAKEFRALFLRVGSGRSSADVEFVRGAARGAGAETFSFEGSFPPPPPGFRTVIADSE